MSEYQYGRIRTMALHLAETGLPDEVVGPVMQGGEEIMKTTSPAAKAAWLAKAMERMDALLDDDTRQSVHEPCPCCFGGKREQLPRAIGKRGGSLEERIVAANETPHGFGDGVELQDDGRILVRFAREGQECYRCVCLRQPTGPVSITYCY